MNITSSVPYAILMVALIPFTKWIVGTSIGPIAATVSLTIGTAPFFARLVEAALREVHQQGLADPQPAGDRGHEQVLQPDAMAPLEGRIGVEPQGEANRHIILLGKFAEDLWILAEQVTTVGAGPYEFAIDVPRARLRPGGQFGLHASVSAPDGSVRFLTDTRVPVSIGDGVLDVHVGQVRLRHVQP